MRKIKAIIFDIGGVLVDLDFKRTLEELNKAGFKDIENQIYSLSKDTTLSQYKLGLISTKEFRDFIRQKINKEISDQDIDNIWNKMLLDIPKEKLDLLLELRKNYTIYALSNTNELHWLYVCNIFKSHNLIPDNFFNEIFLSFKMHKAKPNLDIYEEMIKKSNLIPDETLFIDDSEANCQAASSFGLHTYCYHIGEDLNVIKNLL